MIYYTFGVNLAWAPLCLVVLAEAVGACAGPLWFVHEMTFWLDIRDHWVLFWHGTTRCVCILKLGLSASTNAHVMENALLQAFSHALHGRHTKIRQQGIVFVTMLICLWIRNTVTVWRTTIPAQPHQNNVWHYPHKTKTPVVKSARVIADEPTAE